MDNPAGIVGGSESNRTHLAFHLLEHAPFVRLALLLERLLLGSCVCLVILRPPRLIIVLLLDPEHNLVDHCLVFQELFVRLVSLRLLGGELPVEITLVQARLLEFGQGGLVLLFRVQVAAGTAQKEEKKRVPSGLEAAASHQQATSVQRGVWRPPPNNNNNTTSRNSRTKNHHHHRTTISQTPAPAYARSRGKQAEESLAGGWGWGVDARKLARRLAKLSGLLLLVRHALRDLVLELLGRVPSSQLCLELAEFWRSLPNLGTVLFVPQLLSLKLCHGRCECFLVGP